MAINILVVDDSAVMRKMIIKTILNSGIAVGYIYEAEHGQEGLEQTARHKVDLLFIDVNMPIMDGMEMLSKIRSNSATCEIPVLIVSTESNSERIKMFKLLDAAFVHKPFTPEILREQILTVLGVVN